ncbi:hypothetical protein EC957_011302 [Mortierella hygrophila]|uniref:Uncharacterized protein n=1 Tax=Mortierella hygrophila TaxID=979708 RepID=A0A9P6K476_9FUNG|nr:hypothetical protein EC957_011302 [Mortierella hygrophila]
MASRTQSEEADDEVVDGEDEGEDTMDEIEGKSQIEDNNKNNVRKKLKGGGGENEKNDYDSDNAEDLHIVERSMQRCIEAAHTVIAIIRIFDDTMTNLIMQLAKTEDSAVESEIREELEVCFRFFSILGPYWKDTDEKAKVLRDLLSTHDNKNKQQGPNNNEEDEDDQDHEEGDDDDDEGGNGSGGGGGVEDDEGDEYSADDDGGAEQSLQDLMIADALLDLSNRPPRENYERRRAASRSMPSSSRKVEAIAATITALAFRIITVELSTTRIQEPTSGANNSNSSNNSSNNSQSEPDRSPSVPAFTIGIFTTHNHTFQPFRHHQLYH